MEQNQHEQKDDSRRTSTRASIDTPAAIRAKKDQLFADIGVRFTHHPPNETQIPRYEELRATARELAFNIVELTPTSREQALALTHLEQAVMWANAAIARNE